MTTRNLKEEAIAWRQGYSTGFREGYESALRGEEVDLDSMPTTGVIGDDNGLDFSWSGLIAFTDKFHGAPSYKQEQRKQLTLEEEDAK